MEIPTIQDRRLGERTNWGDIEGQSQAEFVEIWNRCSRDRHYKPKGSDPSFEAGRRIESFISDRFNEGYSGEILAVSHGGVIADFLRNVFSDETLERIRPGFVDDPYTSEIIRECSITTVSFSEKGYRLEEIGAVPPALAG